MTYRIVKVEHMGSVYYEIQQKKHWLVFVIYAIPFFWIPLIMGNIKLKLYSPFDIDNNIFKTEAEAEIFIEIMEAKKYFDRINKIYKRTVIKIIKK